MVFGYMRVSLNNGNQKTDRQKVTLEAYAQENGFKFNELEEDKLSGAIKTENRPGYSRLKAKMRAGDILVITDLDRLGRDADDTILEVKELKARGVKVVALDIPYLNDWKTATSDNDSIYSMVVDILITLKAHMAQQEREITVKRIKQGLAAARARGQRLGRPKAELPKEFIREYRKFKKGCYGEMSKTDFAKMLGIGRSTLYKYIGIYETEN